MKKKGPLQKLKLLKGENLGCVFMWMIFERKMIDLGWLDGDVYVIFFYRFRGDCEVDLKIIFVKVWKGSNWCY